MARWGLTNKATAAKLKMTEATVWQVAPPLCRASSRQPPQRTSSGFAALRRRCRRRDSADARRRQAPPAGACAPYPGRHLSTSNLADLPPETSSQRDPVEGSAVHKCGTACISTRRALGVDEKSQMQALGRTQPLLRPGQAERWTRDYKRNGTTFLFMALDVATRKAKCFRRCRSEEFRKFLNYIEDYVPRTSTSPGQLRDPQDGGRWFARHPRRHVHYSPTSWPSRTFLQPGDGKATEARRPPVDSRLRAGRRQRQPETVPLDQGEIPAQRLYLRTLKTAKVQTKIYEVQNQGARSSISSR